MPRLRAVARPKAFDPTRALDAALQCFKQHGFNGTSLSTLTNEMRVGRASLYATYGDKHALFLQALSDYADTTIGYFEQRLAAAADPLEEIRSVLRDVATLSSCEDGRFGCFLVNSTSELAANDETILRFVQSSFRRLEDAYYGALLRAQKEGKLGPDKDPRALARFVFTNVVGLRILGKAQLENGVLRDAAETAIALLEA
jgi:TetR/AcrR family transcriptional repressor of nem operon